MRHKWIQIEGGLLRCVRCGLTTKPYKVKKGGLPKCEPRDWMSEEVGDDPIVECPFCGKCIPNAQICIICGNRLHDHKWEPPWLRGWIPKPPISKHM